MPDLMVAKAACRKCPFRSDVPIYLRADRRREIVDALVLRDEVFHCHEQVEYSDDAPDEVGEYVVVHTGPMCAGAAKAVLAAGGTTNWLRGAARFGGADLDELASKGPAVWSLSVWPLVPEGGTAATWDPNEEEDAEVATCSTVNAGCLAPAGYLGIGGSVVAGTVAADGECATCGESLCSNCADEDGNCLMCSEDDG